MAAVEKARIVNSEEDLSKIRVGAHDEIFQGDPVLVGADPFSTYCYLLAQEPSRDAATWAIHLLDLLERGLHLEYTVADAGQGLRAGQAEAWPGVPCRGDVFHAESELGKMTVYLENRAYGCIGAREDLERKMERARTKSRGQSFSKKLAIARKEESEAIQLIDDLRLLSQWMREDVLSLTGPAASARRELFDFIVAEMKIREHLAPHRIRPVRIALENQRDQLLAFAVDIDRQLVGISRKRKVPLKDVRPLFELGRLAPDDPLYWLKDNALWDRLGLDKYPVVAEDARPGPPPRRSLPCLGRAVSKGSRPPPRATEEVIRGVPWIASQSSPAPPWSAFPGGLRSPKRGEFPPTGGGPRLEAPGGGLPRADVEAPFAPGEDHRGAGGDAPRVGPLGLPGVGRPADRGRESKGA